MNTLRMCLFVVVAAGLWATPQAYSRGFLRAQMTTESPPDIVTKFFGGVLDADRIAVVEAGVLTEVEFIGQYALKTPDGKDLSLPKAAVVGVLGLLKKGYFDFNFNTKNAAFTKQSDGSWAADITICGTNDGAFTFNPKLPAVGPTNKYVCLSPERFSWYVNAAGKLTRWTIQPLTDGPAGPPGFYVGIGGKVPGSKFAEEPAIVKQFFGGALDADSIAAVDAGVLTGVEFIGKYALKTPDGKDLVLPKAAVVGVLGLLKKGYSDFAFNTKKAVFTKQLDGSWAADITICGTNDGAFTFNPALPAVGPNNKYVCLSPERFSWYVNADGKLTRWTIQPLTDGPAGPPGFYVGAGGSFPVKFAEEPAIVKQFFGGVLDADKIAVVDAGVLTGVEFIGKYALKTPDGKDMTLPKAAVVGVLGLLKKGYSDFTFNTKKAVFTKQLDGSWAADITICGTNDGKFTFNPKLPAVGPTNKYVCLPLERFSWYVNEAGKLTRWTIRPLTNGPAGPPGFYTQIGGKIPGR